MNMNLTFTDQTPYPCTTRCEWTAAGWCRSRYSQILCHALGKGVQVRSTIGAKCTQSHGTQYRCQVEGIAIIKRYNIKKRIWIPFMYFYYTYSTIIGTSPESLEGFCASGGTARRVPFHDLFPVGQRHESAHRAHTAWSDTDFSCAWLFVGEGCGIGADSAAVPRAGVSAGAVGMNHTN